MITSRRFTWMILASVLISLVTISAVNAETDEVITETRSALAEYKRGNYSSAIESFETLLSQNRSVRDKADSIRDEVSLDLAREFIENNLSDPGMRSRLRALGQWFLQGRTNKDSIHARISNDPAGIARFVDEYMTESNLVLREQRGHSIRDQYGEFAVPYIHNKYMGSDNTDTRLRARTLLITIGMQALQPLVQVMHSESDQGLDRETAALALGGIGSAIALPVLQEHLESSSENERVRDACARALQSIGVDGKQKGMNAKTLWFRQAEAYYRNESSGGYTFAFNRLIGSTYPGHLPTFVNIDGLKRSYPVWRWVGSSSSLEFEEVPHWNLADVLAEECILNAINADKGSAGGGMIEQSPFLVDAYALLACISTRQYVNGQTRLNFGTDDEKAFIRSVLGEMGVVRTKHLKGYAASFGPTVLFSALSRSLNDGYPLISVELCNSLLDVDPATFFASTRSSERRPMEDELEDAFRSNDGRDFQGYTLDINVIAPLIQALESSDRRVRYAASRALIKLGRTHTFGHNAKAQSVFGQSLGETESRTIAIIAEDQQIRQSFTKAIEDLQSRGYSVAVASYDNLEEGIKQIQLSPVMDAIIMEAEIAGKPTFFWAPDPSGLREGSPERRNELPLELLQSDVRTQSIPILLVAPDARVGQYQDKFSSYLSDENFFGYGENVNLRSDDALESLDSTLSSLFLGDVEAQRQFSTNAFVTDSANMLSAIDPNYTSYDVNLFMSQLESSIGKESGRSSEAKIALANAIAHLAAYDRLSESTSASLLATLVEILDNDEAVVDTPAVRAATARAIGAIYGNHPSFFRGSIGSDAYHALKMTLRLQFDGISDLDDDLYMKILGDVERARNAAGVALGRMPLSALQVKEVADEQRASRHIPLSEQGRETAAQ